MPTPVNTVDGPVIVTQLGVTLFHEHLVSGIHGRELVDVGYFDEQHAFEQCRLRVGEAAEAGVRTLIDVTPIDLGRNVVLDWRVARATDVQIICATGLHNQRLGQPTWFRSLSEDDLAEIFVREITSGIRDTGIRAGVIKVGTGSREVRSSERKALVAAARAQHLTGAPIITHTDHGKFAREQLSILEAAGADLAHVVIGHVDPLPPDDAEALLRSGVMLGYDRIGHSWLMPDEQRAAHVAELVQRGWGSRILLSHDHNVASALDAYTHHTPKGYEWRVEIAFRFIHERFLSMLDEAGVGGDVAHRMLTENVAALWS